MYDVRAREPGRPDDTELPTGFSLEEEAATVAALERQSTAPHVSDVEEAYRQIRQLGEGVVRLGHALVDDLDAHKETVRNLNHALLVWADAVEERLREIERAAGLRPPLWKRVLGRR